MNDYNKQPSLGPDRVREAAERLARYRKGKQPLDARLYDEALWWRERHMGISRAGSVRRGVQPASAWLFNSAANKHADLCDRIPTCTCLPREPGDEADAELMSRILPVITERCGFAEAYARNAWTKIKHGMAAWGIFWNPALENGLGDIDIRRLNVQNIFWEPGVCDLQESPHLYVLGLEDTDALLHRYPWLGSKLSDRAAAGSLAYETDGSFLFGGRAEAAGGKTVVTDWYYKVTGADGRTVLHYAKLVGDILLYASENDPAYAERGWYDHGQYPIVLDVLYPDEDSPAGFGLIAVGRNPQGYVDELDGCILEYASWASRVRYWAKRSLGVNEKDFLDPDKRIIQVEGDIDEEKLRQITLAPLDGLLTEVRRMKIDELKETTGARDFNQGSIQSGVTAAAAITALQEAGNKGSRDCIEGSYRAYLALMRQAIELIRQFYDGVRIFRIVGKDGKPTFVRFSNACLADRQTGTDAAGNPLYRRPVFDIDVRAETQSPMERTARNELMLSMFNAGMFDADKRQAAALALSGMSFEGADTLRAGMSGEEEA